MSYTLLDLAKLEAGLAYPVINETLKMAPEINVFPAATIDGSTMELSVRTGNPTAAFRNANEGTAYSQATFKNKVFQTFILDHQVKIDEAMLRSRKAAAQGRLKTEHQLGAMEASFHLIGSQIYYGSSETSKGFPGLIEQYDTSNDVAAGGSGGSTSSVWFLNLGVGNIELLFGNGQTITFDPTWKMETVLDSSSNPYQAETNWMKGNVGLRLANKYAASRITGIDTGSNKLDDPKLYDLLEKYTTASGRMPSHIFMTPRSHNQLRASRTATNADGTPVSLPSTFEGIPIVPTSSITNTETA